MQISTDLFAGSSQLFVEMEKVAEAEIKPAFSSFEPSAGLYEVKEEQPIIWPAPNGTNESLVLDAACVLERMI